MTKNLPVNFSQRLHLPKQKNPASVSALFKALKQVARFFHMACFHMVTIHFSTRSPHIENTIPGQNCVAGESVHASLYSNQNALSNPFFTANFKIFRVSREAFFRHFPARFGPPKRGFSTGR